MRLKSDKKQPGLSLIEVLIGVVVFVLAFIPLMRLFSETGLAQQRMLRDFPVTLSIAERVLMTIENEIEEGRFDAAMFDNGNPNGVDITEAVVENAEVSLALEKFYGKDNQDATKYISQCRVFLLSRPTADPNLIQLTINFFWSDRRYGDQKFPHQVTLHLLKRKE